MNYVNEYASPDDVAAFNLDEIWNKYHPFDKRPQAGSVFEWTVDRNAKSFLTLLQMGREELAGTLTFAFQFESEVYEVVLGYTGPERMDASPFRIGWRLLRLDPQPESQLKEAFICALREALEVYGYRGIRKQLPNTLVTLDL